MSFDLKRESIAVANAVSRQHAGAGSGGAASPAKLAAVVSSNKVPRLAAGGNGNAAPAAKL